MSNPDVPILTEGEKLHGIALAQAATHAYLTTLLAATDCMVDTCPDIGMAFKRRWARAPQRIGFEPTAEALETSSRAVVSDLKAFSEDASAYFHPAIPLIEKVGGQGALVADSVLEKVAAHSVLLETAGDALMTLADEGWIRPSSEPPTRWEVTARILSVAHAAHGGNDLRRRARARLEQLRDAIRALEQEGVSQLLRQAYLPLQPDP